MQLDLCVLSAELNTQKSSYFVYYNRYVLSVNAD